MFIDIMSMVPIWVGPIVAIVSYPAFYYGGPWLICSRGSDARFNSGFNTVLTSFCHQFAVFVPVFVLLLWGASLVVRWKRWNRLTKTGSLSDIGKMTWREFEELVAEAYRRQGYDATVTGSAGGDGGVDVVLRRDGQETLVQCKQWRARQVGVKVVREMVGVVADAGAARGIIVTYGRFSEDAQSFADNNGIELVDGAALERMIAEAKRPKAETTQRPSSSPPPQPKSASPRCPDCGGAMTRRVSHKGHYAGKPFWGCTRYPQCRGIVPIEDEEA